MTRPHSHYQYYELHKNNCFFVHRGVHGAYDVEAVGIVNVMHDFICVCFMGGGCRDGVACWGDGGGDEVPCCCFKGIVAVVKSPCLLIS